MEYATRDETTLYIQGGTPDNGLPVSNQLYALDLTRPSWNTTNPPWSALSVGSGLQASPITYLQSMVISKDQQSLSIWDTLGSISTYNITSNAWSNPASLPPSTKKVTKLNAAMDPTSGLIYLPSGFESGAVNVYAMMVYNPATRAALSLPMPSDESTLAGLAYFSLVWSTARSSMLLYGGVSVVNFTVSTPSFFEFLPAAAMWAPVKTTGTSPGQVYNHCMVPAYGGTKMIVFGGRYTSGVDSGSIYILDVKTMDWTQGTAADPSQNRTGMACTVAGDNFVAWGGDYNTSTSKFTAPIIYNLKSNQWTTQFSLAPSPSITSSTGAPSSTSASAAANGPNGPSAAAIGGGVVGAIVALVLGIFLFKYCRRTRAQGAEGKASSS
ncbi:hypothetical protein BGX30_002366 [Mortierella sp. GBA39]|nr:hypothetical protein BGX30_002366 [Mortierella sp. GBA39]